LKYENGLLDIGIKVESGFIRDLTLRGDFFGIKDIDEITDYFIGLPYEKSAVETILTRFQLTDFVYKLSNELFIESLFSNSL
jgi:lipoate-protein ligase A